MKLGYTIIYVANVAASLDFFERAFGFTRRFLHESGDYGELETGTTTLSFAAHALGAMNLPDGYIAADQSLKPLGMEIALVVDPAADVSKSLQAAHARALAAGASELKAPTAKPWGQIVSWVRAPDGTLVELCTPMG